MTASNAQDHVAGMVADVHLTRGAFCLDVGLRAGRGEVVAVVGPNGSGKTTLVRALTGLQPLDRGRITLDGEVLDDPGEGVAVLAERRPVGMLFQRGLLFPHLTALDNVAFGLRCRGTARAEAASLAAAWLDRLGVGACSAQRPATLSGGQAQRVALARALALSPRLLLLDEPLASVDAPSRPALRAELAAQARAFAGAQVLVTHDPLEALTLADRVVVLEEGSVVQEGTAAELRSRPASPYVASLVGVNVFRGRAQAGTVRLAVGGEIVAAATTSGEVVAVVHPRAVSVHLVRPEGSPRNVWPGTVVALHITGERARVDVSGPVPIVAEVTPAAVEALGLAPASAVWVSVKAAEVDLHPA